MQPEPARAQLRQAPAAHDHDADRHQGEQRVADQYLRHRVARAQPFDQRVHQAEQAKGESAEADAGGGDGRDRVGNARVNGGNRSHRQVQLGGPRMADDKA